jgi:glycogen operon protein
MLKAVVTDAAYTWGSDTRPEHSWHDLIIYEAHAKGLTMKWEDVPPAWRGSYRGLASKAVIDHLHRLGVTAIELLPIHAFLDDRYLVDKNLRNYWGYNSIGFFTPEPRYTPADDALAELKSTISQLHQAGIEVILDVVYNHTAEGSELGPTLSFRGIDNASYYWLRPDEPRYYENFTGTGNALNLTHPYVLRMVMDSLRYWVEQCHIDGFRFDLATTLARGPNGFDSHSGFLAAVAQDPVLSRVKMIAEPWDIGLGGYQVGGFPQGWSEWNDKFRHALRRYWRGDAGLIGEVAARMSGSADVYQGSGRPPRASINHITVHDGFTLADLTAYNQKHNEANGEDNRDGSDDNQSNNWGAEGPAEDPHILDMRSRARRNMLATLFLARGVPLLLAGDEVSNSQNGNNNAYCQDDEIGWVDWSGRGRNGDDHIDFVAKLTALRRKYVQLQPHHWLNGHGGNRPPDIMWLTPHGAEMGQEDWEFAEARFLAYVLNAPPLGGTPLFVVMNAGSDPVEFVFPEFLELESWAGVLTTAPDVDDIGRFHVGSKQQVPGRTLTIYEGCQ